MRRACSRGLWYSRPTGEWLEAVPIGNSRLGGMVYGGVRTERIGLNEDTLWSGGPKDCDNPQALKTLPEIRRLIFEGKYTEAHQLGKKRTVPLATETGGRYQFDGQLRVPEKR
ncbi:MAG: glycoside hydrolase N-terminal domain-containing protein [Isosphaeraceae bacterium]